MTEIKKSVKIYQRAMAMICLSIRYDFEALFKRQQGFTQEDMEELQAFFENLQGQTALLSRLSPGERYCLFSPVGSWPEEVMTPFSWHIEGAGTILWALGELNRLPPLDESFSESTVQKYFRGDILDTSWISKYMTRNKFPLRDPGEIGQAMGATRAVWLRCLYSQEVRESKRPLSRKTYNEVFHFDYFGLPVGSSGDVQIGGREFCDLSESEEGEIYPRALVRLQAFLWILDTNLVWEKIELPMLEDSGFPLTEKSV